MYACRVETSPFASCRSSQAAATLQVRRTVRVARPWISVPRRTSQELLGSPGGPSTACGAHCLARHRRARKHPDGPRPAQTHRTHRTARPTDSSTNHYAPGLGSTRVSPKARRPGKQRLYGIAFDACIRSSARLAQPKNATRGQRGLKLFGSQQDMAATRESQDRNELFQKVRSAALYSCATY